VAGAPDHKIEDIDFTPEMIEAGEVVILTKVGGAEDLGALFLASGLAREVFRAMWDCRASSRTSPRR
jgi:hypothetical protein